MKNRHLWPVALTLFACTGLDELPPDPSVEALEIEGTFHSTFGGTETFSGATFPSGARVIEFDNDNNFAITQNAADDMFNPNKFGKVVWTEPMNGHFFYCFVTSDEDTEIAARMTTETADDTTPRDGGCDGFPWTEIEPLLEIEGLYDSNFGSEEMITSDMWGTATVRGYDNGENLVFLQLPETDMFNPNKFNRVVYTELTNDIFYYCWVEFGLDSIEQAKTSTATADANDPENSGCGGFSWTKLTRR